MLGTIFAILAILASVLLILVVLVQNSKGGGLSSTFGASNISSMVGAARSTQQIEKVTWYLLAAVLFFSFAANMTITTEPTQPQGTLNIQEQIQQGNFMQQAPPQPTQQPGGAPAGGEQPEAQPAPEE